jgi:hypothetical protein
VRLSRVDQYCASYENQILSKKNEKEKLIQDIDRVKQEYDQLINDQAGQ